MDDEQRRGRHRSRALAGRFRTRRVRLAAAGDDVHLGTTTPDVWGYSSTPTPVTAVARLLCSATSSAAGLNVVGSSRPADVVPHCDNRTLRAGAGPRRSFRNSRLARGGCRALQAARDGFLRLVLSRVLRGLSQAVLFARAAAARGSSLFPGTSGRFRPVTVVALHRFMPCGCFGLLCRLRVIGVYRLRLCFGPLRL